MAYLTKTDLTVSVIEDTSAPPSGQHEKNRKWNFIDAKLEQKIISDVIFQENQNV